MNYSKVINPKWANAEHTAIECMVDFDDLSEELVPFTAVAEGDYPHTHEIFARCVAGDFGPIAEYVAPPVVELTYAQKRAAEYPPITDYLDGVVKGDQAQIDKYIADCQAVKVKYPKPQA